MSDTCRYANHPLHVCSRRDGRVLQPGEDGDCWMEARARLAETPCLADEDTDRAAHYTGMAEVAARGQARSPEADRLAHYTGMALVARKAEAR